MANTVDPNHIIDENKRRNDFLFAEYDPIFGTNSLVPRIPFWFRNKQKKPVMIPVWMGELEIIQKVINYGKPAEQYAIDHGLDDSDFQKHLNQLRMAHDFEFYAFLAITIEDKKSGQRIKLKCRYSQRRIIANLEKQRNEGKPVRLNIPKSRQFGSTTVIQAYCFWIQNVVKQNWHVAVAAHLDDAAKNIREMYVNIAADYPPDLGTITLKPYANSTKNKKVEETGSIIAVGSSQSPDNLRGYSFKVLHLSEVAYYVATDKKKPEDLARTLVSTVPLEKDTIIVRESTCNGVGTYWHRVCMSSLAKKSKYEILFVPFFEIELYHLAVEDPIEFIKSLSEYEWELWNQGASLEAIHWYRNYQATEEYDDWRMRSEYPSNVIEAFQGSGHRFFAQSTIAQQREFNCDPILVGDVFADAYTGEEAMNNVTIEEHANGRLRVFEMPELHDEKGMEWKNRYCVAVDIGGRSAEADESVIKVFDRKHLASGGMLYPAAVWSGKIDFDKLAWKAVQICILYGNAFMIPEMNKQRESDKFDEGPQFYTLVDEIKGHYDNIFCRTSPEEIRNGRPRVYGFHTNTQTKPMVLNALNKALRDINYMELDSKACDQYDSFENKGDGKAGAAPGAHDDHVMATAIGVWCSIDYLPECHVVNPQKVKAVMKKTGLI